MRAASIEFRRTMTQRRNFVNYADMTLSNGTVLHLAPEDFRLGGNTITDDLVDGDAFSVGSAIGKMVTLCIDNTHEFFSNYDFYNATFVLYVALPLPTEQEPDRVEKIRIGMFTVITPATTGTVITMEAVDNMYLFDRSYNESTLAYPATLQQIVNEACTHCGVVDNTGQFDRYLMLVPQRPEGDITYRQVISYVAQIAGVNAKIDEYGALKFIWYSDTLPEDYVDGGNFRHIYIDGHYATGDELDGGTFAFNDGDDFDGGTFITNVSYHDLGFAKSVQVSTDDIVITGVQVKNGDDEDHIPRTEGWDAYPIVLDDNPLTVGNEFEIASALYAKLMVLKFRPFSLSYLQDPTIESGDWVIVSDVKRNSYISFITNASFTTGGYMQLSCNAQPPVKQGSTYQSAAAKAMVEAARQAAKEANKEISTYDTMVQRMHQLAANAGGLYWLEVPQIDGSIIHYESDKPMSIDSQGDIVFTQHSHAWKRTGSGFFNCPDTGVNEATTTWVGGIDANNNAVMNTVSAIGINADWINAGQVTAARMATNVITAINAPKEGKKVYLTFDSRCETEVNLDFIRFYYKDGNQWYISNNYSGTTLAGKTLSIPTSNFYVEWKSDSSVEKWGVEVVGGGLGNQGETVSFQTAPGLPSLSVTDVGQNVSAIKTSHPYSSNENTLWQVTFADSSITINADRININGTVTLTDYTNGLANGSTVISGDCIKTGTLEGVTLISDSSQTGNLSKIVIEGGEIKSYWGSKWLGAIRLTQRQESGQTWNDVGFDFSESDTCNFTCNDKITFATRESQYQFSTRGYFDSDGLTVEGSIWGMENLILDGYINSKGGFAYDGDTGVSGSFTTADGKYVQVNHGIITWIN